MEALLVGAALGGIAAFVAVYNQNGVAGLMIFFLGVVILVGFGTVQGPTAAPSAFIDTFGVPGLIGAVGGAVVGGVVGENLRKSKGG